MYFSEINASFDIINIKLLNDKIDLKFSKEDFIIARNNLDKKLKQNKIKFQELIDSKYKNMEDEYDKLIKDFKDGNFKDYNASIEETVKKINIIKKDLEKNMNNEFNKFREDMIKELDFIGNRLKELKISKEKNINSIEIFKSVDETQIFVYLIYGSIVLLPVLAPVVAFESIYDHSDYRTIPSAIAIDWIFLACCTGIGLPGVGIGALIAASIGGLIHGGFSLYKKLTEKEKYIESIENEKISLKNSCSEVKKEINKNLEENKKQLESAVDKFERSFLSKNEGIKNHKEEWLSLFQKFKKIALNLKLISE